MAYNITFKKSVQKDLAHIDRGETRRILDKIETDPARQPDACPMLKGPFAGLRKFRVGDYRIIFAILEQDVLILRIGHRREVYNR